MQGTSDHIIESKDNSLSQAWEFLNKLFDLIVEDDLLAGQSDLDFDLISDVGDYC